MIYEKPKNEIFASDAKDGEVVEFPNIKRGWGVTENLGFIPPMEYFNAAFNRVDKSIAYQLQRGVGEWDKDLEYPIGAVVSLNGVVYVAKSQNINKKPSENKEIWHVIASEEWCEQTFLNKDDKIDAYNKTESDEKFALKTELQKAIPVGSYLLYSSNTNTPDGFLRCDGSALDKTTYAALFAVIGYTYGRSGDKFLLPNFSDGKFMRSIGGKAAILGQAQQDELKSHKHYQYSGGNVMYSNDQLVNPTAYWIQNLDISCKGWTSEVGGNETRPYNMAVVVLIKY